MWFGQDGPIRIEARAEGGSAVVEVHRDGTGPDGAEAERMFAGPGDESSRIGLHVARLIAEALGGSLVAEGGDGIRFRLTLPA
jgi:two-component sensor histidine kinase